MFAHLSMVIPFQCLGTWERGRETVVYLGWEMAGLGNRTLCHSLCHSLCDPDLFPAFLTPPLSWGKWCSSSNPHSILTKSWDTVLKKGTRVWKASSVFCTIGSPPAFLGVPSPKCSQEPLLSVLPGCGLAVGLHNAQFCTSISFLTVCYFCFSAFLKRSSNPVLQFSLTFSFLKNHVFFYFICPAHTIFLLLHL